MDSVSRRSKMNGIENSDGRDGKAVIRRRPLTITELLRSTSSTLATIMFAWSIIKKYCPYSLRQYLRRYIDKFIDYIYPNPYTRIAVYEFVGDRLSRNRAFVAVEAYLSNKLTDDAKKLKVEVGVSNNNFSLSMDEYERVTDKYENAEFWWTKSKIAGSAKNFTLYPEPDRRCYQLKFHNKNRKLVIESYLKHVLKAGKEIGLNRRRRKLYTNGTGNRSSYRQSTLWSQVYFEHPASFDTIGMDPEKKQEIMEDLLTFSQSKEYYARIGKAWKRGYLLYGPPGTGKSTMIAAMANLLNYDRLMIFTTNHVEKLDPALIRRGRMDKHIELSYCSYESFKVLAKNYLNFETHELFEEIKEEAESSLRRLIGSLEEVKKTPEEKKNRKVEKSKESSSSEKVNK